MFSTKNRERTIRKDLCPELHAYIVGTLKGLGCPSIQTGGTDDHVHTLFSLGRSRSVADVAEDVKKRSSKWMKSKGGASFSWQAGYGAFSVSESNVAEVVRYIERQEEHHSKMTFKEELVLLLERHRVKFDNRYLWD